MIFKCPKGKHSTTDQECAARKARKHRGCPTCTYPRLVAQDQKFLADLVIGYDLQPTGANKHRRIYIKGLVKGQTIRLSRLLAQELRKRLEAVLAR